MPGSAISGERLRKLPEPVRRHLEAANIVGIQPIRKLRLTQRGSMRMSEEGRWLPFAAWQAFSTDPPAFVWKARIRGLPSFLLSVTDEFVNGHGHLAANGMGSLFKFAEGAGPEFDQGELLRYLAETIWFPTIWASEQIVWRSVDARSAEATMRVGGLSVPAIFEFNAQGFAERVRGERYRMDKSGKFTLGLFSGAVADYRRAADMLVPMKVTASWHLRSGDFTYFRGEVRNIQFRS